VAPYDFNAQRLFVEATLFSGARVEPPPTAQNYLLNVLRLREGAPLLVFNGRDGEWRAEMAMATRRAAALVVREQTRAQSPRSELEYAFAPLKQARLDYMAQKAAEMGVGRLAPVLTRRTQVRRVNCARIRANVIEAAEQCGLLSLPVVEEAQDLANYVAASAGRRLLVFCDEEAPVADPIEALRAAIEKPRRERPHDSRVSLVIGPEGGFDADERAQLLGKPDVVQISLGPRILRADTAAVAALALIQATIGDWRREWR